MITLSVHAKSYVVLAIVLGCFGILYPKLFHPMLMSSLGYYKQPSVNDDNLMHPRERMMRGGPSVKPVQQSGGQHTPYAHGRPNPAMRMGAEGQQRVGSSGRGGIMTMILPLYAIGIVLYLLYTLVKVFGGGKKENSSANDNAEQSLRSRLRDFDSLENDRLRSSAGSLFNCLQNGTYVGDKTDSMQKDLEQLLRKVEDRSMSDSEMQDLRSRLEDTEAQMTRILQQMQTVQRHVGASANRLATTAHATQNGASVPPSLPQDHAMMSDSETDEFGDASSDVIIEGGGGAANSVDCNLTQRAGFVAEDLH